MIGTNKKDATETAELLLEDARAGRLRRGADAPAIDALLAERGVVVVTQSRAGRRSTPPRRAAGEPHGRPRVKLSEWDALLAAAAGSATPALPDSTTALDSKR